MINVEKILLEMPSSLVPIKEDTRSFPVKATNYLSQHHRYLSDKLDILKIYQIFFVNILRVV